MAQVSMTIRMDEGLKASFDALCSQMGMSANKAMNSLARYFVITKKLGLIVDPKTPITREEYE